MNDYLLLMEYLVNLVILISHVTLYGYFELKWDSGWIMTILIALYLVYNTGKSLPTFIAIAGFIAHYYQHQKLSSVFFLMLEMIYFFGSQSKDIDGDEIKFKPHEKEIRQYLFRKDPSLLHKVDSLLEKYAGREDELMRKLRTKYDITTHTAPPQKSSQETQSSEEPKVHVTPQDEPSTKWGPFDNAFAPPSTSTTSNSQHKDLPFSSPPSQPSGFSLFLPPTRSTNVSEGRRFSTNSTNKLSGQYGAFDLNEDDDREQDSSLQYRRQSTGTTSYDTGSYRENTFGQESSSHPRIFHAQTNEVEEAKRKAREAQQYRINQRLHHHS